MSDGVNPAKMPEGWSFAGRFLFRLGMTALAVVLLFVLWRAADIVLLSFFGLLFGVFLLTIANFLSRRFVTQGRWSLLLALFLLVALLLGVGWLVGPRLADQFNQLVGQVSQPVQQIEDALAQYAWGDWLLERAPVLEQPTSADGGEAAPTGTPGTLSPDSQGETPGGGEGDGLPFSAGAVVSRVFGVLGSLLGILANLLLVVFIGIFLAANPALYQSGVVRLFPPERRERAREVMNELGRTLQGWLLGQLVSMTIVGVLTGLGLWLLGMPLVLVLALIAFLFEFIPIVGPWLSGVPAVLLAFTESPTKALWVVVLYLVIQQLEGNLILPLVQRRAVDLPPALTLFSVFLFGALFGFVGLLVATPLMAVILVLVKMVYLKDVWGDAVKLPGNESRV